MEHPYKDLKRDEDLQTTKFIVFFQAAAVMLLSCCSAPTIDQVVNIEAVNNTNVFLRVEGNLKPEACE